MAFAFPRRARVARVGGDEFPVVEPFVLLLLWFGLANWLVPIAYIPSLGHSLIKQNAIRLD